MSNEISFNLSVGVFGMDRDFIEIVNHIYSFSAFDKFIEIDNPCGAGGYTYIKAYGTAPWISSLEWFCKLVEEKKLSADFYAGDCIGNVKVKIQWREGNCVYQKDSSLYYLDDDNNTIYYDDDDEEAILLLKGEKNPPLREYLEKNYKMENEKRMKKLFETLNDKVDEDKAKNLPF